MKNNKNQYVSLIFLTIISSLLAAIFFALEEDLHRGLTLISVSFTIFALSHLYLPDWMREDEDNEEDNEEN